MRDYVTGCHFMQVVFPAPAKPKPYTTLRAQRRHVYDWPQGRYRPAATHAEAMERYGFRVTNGGAR